MAATTIDRPRLERMATRRGRPFGIDSWVASHLSDDRLVQLARCLVAIDNYKRRIDALKRDAG